MTTSPPVRADQRFTATNPCPTCGGYNNQARGKGERCYGFRSTDGLYAHCTREEFAGGMPIEPDANTYAHRIVGGDCRCGVRHDPAPPPINGKIIHDVPRSSNGTGSRIVAEYGYEDEARALLYQSVRKQPKAFLQRRPDGRGGWINNLEGVRRVPYRLPQLLAADPSEVVFIPEGEKDANVLATLGLVATTNAMGAGKWRDEYSEYLRDRNVVVIADHDEPGRKHAEKVARSLHGVAREIRIICFTDLPDAADVSDWLAADPANTAAELKRLAQAQPTWEPPDTKTSVYPRTDAGNGELFASLYGDRLRYDYRRGIWLVFRRHWWQPDHDGEVVRLAKEAARTRYVAALSLDDHDERMREAKFATGSENKHRIDAMLSLARAERPLADTGEGWDADPWVLAVANGIIDLRTGLLRDGRPEDRISRHAPVTFNAEAECPLWNKFIDRILPVRDVREYVQRLAGYCLTGDVSEESIQFFYGEGQNGKTTYIKAVQTMLGTDLAIQASKGLLLATKHERHTTEIAELHGRRMVVSTEVDDGSAIAEGLLKWLTGGDKIRGRFMHRDNFEFDPTFKIILLANKQPTITADDVATWRRIKVVPFTVTIPEDERDNGLKQKLLAELPGILNWAIAGCLAWQRNGMGEPSEVADATKSYREKSLAGFIEDCLIERADVEIGAGKAFTKYTEWATAQGIDPKLNGTQFGVQMGNRYEKRKDNRGAFYVGVGARAVTDDANNASGGV